MSYMQNNTFVKAVQYIYNHIDQPLSLDVLARAVGLSTSSLKRLFLEATGSSAGLFIRRLRMNRAFRSLKDKELSILEVALQSGFEDHSAFTRAFKEHFGYSPTQARDKLNIIQELESISLEQPEIIEIDAIPVQAITSRGTYFEAAPQSWSALKSKFSPDDDFTGMYIGIGHDNPHDGGASEEDVRFSAGVALYPHDLEIEHITLSGGMYAKFSYWGKLNNLGMAYHYIYGAWAHQSPVHMSTTLPAFMVFGTFPDALENQHVAIYVPLNDELTLKNYNNTLLNKNT